MVKLVALDVVTGALTALLSERLTSHQLSDSYIKKLLLFNKDITYSYLASAMTRSDAIKTTDLTDAFRYEDYLAQFYNGLVSPLYLDNGKVGVFTGSKVISPKVGTKTICLILKPQAKTTIDVEND